MSEGSIERRNGILYGLRSLLDCMRAMPEKIAALIAVTLLLIAGCASATVAVKPGDRIQAAIDAAIPGDRIEVYSGTYQESLVINKPIVLKGIDSGSGLPRVETENGPAITLKADGIVLEGFWAKSASGWTEDAGILVLSNNNVIRNNMASGNGNAGMLFQECHNNTIAGNVALANSREGLSLKNCSRNILQGNQVKENKYGLKLVNSQGNEVLGNSFLQNRYEAIYMQNCQSNLIEGNYAGSNDGGLIMDTCRDNIVQKNDFVGNVKGISVSYLDVSKGIKSQGKGVVISYNSMPSEESASSNNTFYLNNLSNKNNAYDDSLDRWDNGKLGNNYSNFNDASEGCKGKKICDSEYRIPGGHSVDQFPLAAPAKIPGRSSGPGGAVLQLFQFSFLPGGEMRVNFTSPATSEVWLGVALGNQSQNDLYLGRNITGDVVLTAPLEEGSYRLRMHDKNGTEVMSMAFRVAAPGIFASPLQVGSCEKIFVAFFGASGQTNDWIGMFRAGTSDVASRQNLMGQENGNITFSSSDGGSFEFKMFAAGASEPLASSNTVEVKATSGAKVVAEPSHVAPGGTVTITYWGAPPEGTGVIGMYGMTRPDKFDLGKRPIGSRSCGSMTWQLPYASGQYDFRMFHDDINRPLIAQSNVVTVG